MFWCHGVKLLGTADKYNNIYIIILQGFGEKAPRKKTTHKTDE
jgi:hypothetical protein